jgi:hypothetical protein
MIRNSGSESNQLSSALYGSFIPPSGGTAIKDETVPEIRRADGRTGLRQEALGFSAR